MTGQSDRIAAPEPLSPSAPLDFDRVPVVDIGPLVHGESAEPTIAELADACERVGFVYLTGHGCDTRRLDTLRSAAAAFFTAPPDQRMAARVNHRMRGFLPLDYTSYEGESREARSHQQGYWMGIERDERAEAPLDGPNVWPPAVPELQPAMEGWLAELRPFAVVVRRALARALGLEAGALDEYFEGELSRLKLNHYPSMDSPVTTAHLGVVPHTDSGAFTLLWQDDSGGLEVINRAGDWVGAPPVADTLVLNLGAIMDIWSGGRFPATAHRVQHVSGGDRYSIPLFVNPGTEAVIAPLVPGQHPSTSPFRYGDYQIELWRRTFPIAYT